MTNPEQQASIITSKLKEELAERLQTVLSEELPSRTLRSEVRVVVRKGEFRVVIPYYWAPYVLFGRRRARPRGKRLLWFRNPREDPRLANGYPRRRSDVVSMREAVSQSEWKRLKKEDRARRKRGLRPKMIFARVSEAVAPQVDLRAVINETIHGSRAASSLSARLRQLLSAAVRDLRKK